MKKFSSGLFFIAFVALVCVLSSGSAPAQEMGFPPCCFNTPETELGEQPVTEEAPVIIAQEMGFPPCCFNSPEVEAEEPPATEPEPILITQEMGFPPCCFNSPEAEAEQTS